MGSAVRAALRAVPGLFWVAGVWAAVAWFAHDRRGHYIAVFCAVLGVVQLVRGRDTGFVASRSGARSAGGDLTLLEALIGVLIGGAVLGGAVVGWLSTGTIWAVVGGAVIFGAVAVILTSVLTIVVAGLAELLGRLTRLRARPGR